MLVFGKCRLRRDESFNVHPAAPKVMQIQLYPDDPETYLWKLTTRGVAVGELQRSSYGMDAFRIQRTAIAFA